MRNTDVICDCDFLEQLGEGEWRTTKELKFKTRYGDVVVPAGFDTDLFSVVPNTKFPDFWKASILHDRLYYLINKKDPDRLIKKRRHADLALYDEMLIQSAVIFGKLQDYCGLEMAVDTFHSLLRTSKIYYHGVSGVLGRIYQFFAE